MTPCWALFALFFVICANAAEEEEKKAKSPSFARGWGDNITWVKTYEEALSKTAETKKPLMVILHREDCPYSKVLKKAFAAEKSIQKMAREDFIMVNLVEETRDKNLAPDGYYVPRILFIDPSLTVHAEITGKYTNRRYTYEPGDMTYLAENMKTAKALVHKEKHREL
ncbi:hypothetical protein LDENG_00053770 [Lucifuga dentata]|nr:hypothetical protein LDENG_00053770 [Lucifuga dentata]